MIDIYYKLTLPFAVVSMLAFMWFSYTKNRKVFTFATITSIIAFVFLTIVLLSLKINYGLAIMTIEGTRYLILAWVIMLIYYIAQYKYRIRLLGAIQMPIAMMLIIMSVFFTGNPPRISIQFSNLSTFSHVSLVFIGLGLLFLAFAASLLYFVKQKALKKHDRAALDGRLPALPVIEKIMESSFKGGYPIFTLGLILGILYAGMALKTGWIFEAKIIWGLINWSLYSILFFAIHVTSMKKQVFARGVIVLFLVVVASFMLTKHEKLEAAQDAHQVPSESQGGTP